MPAMEEPTRRHRGRPRKTGETSQVMDPLAVATGGDLSAIDLLAGTGDDLSALLGGIEPEFDAGEEALTEGDIARHLEAEAGVPDMAPVAVPETPALEIGGADGGGDRRECVETVLGELVAQVHGLAGMVEAMVKDGIRTKNVTTVDEATRQRMDGLDERIETLTNVAKALSQGLDSLANAILQRLDAIGSIVTRLHEDSAVAGSRARAEAERPVPAPDPRLMQVAANAINILKQKGATTAPVIPLAQNICQQMLGGAVQYTEDMARTLRTGLGGKVRLEDGDVIRIL